MALATRASPDLTAGMQLSALISNPAAENDERLTGRAPSIIKRASERAMLERAFAQSKKSAHVVEVSPL